MFCTHIVANYVIVTIRVEMTNILYAIVVFWDMINIRYHVFMEIRTRERDNKTTSTNDGKK